MKTLFLLALSLLLGGVSIAQVDYHVSTILPEGSNVLDDGLTIDENGTIYASYWGIWQGATGRHIYRIRKNGQMDTLAVGFNRPNGIHYSEGYVYVANSQGHNVSRIDTLTGQVDVFMSIINPSNILKIPGEDSVLIVSYSGRKLYGYSDWHGLNEISSSSRLNGPVGLAIDSSKNIYVSNFDDGKILRLNSQNDFDIVADIGGGSGFITINGNNLYATNHTDKKVYKVSLLDSSVSVIAGSGKNIIEDGVNDSASFKSPNGIVTTASGDSIYISEYQGKALRLIEVIPSDTDTVATGMNNPIIRNSIKVYPQPASKECWIEFAHLESIESVQLLDITGASIKTSWHKAADGVMIELGNIPSGTYIIQVQSSDDEVYTEKILVSS